jgi:starvation-inducible outer membrane lipoprotein
MRTLPFIAALALSISACGTPHPNFLKMSEEELSLYNSQASLEDRVYCRNEVRAGSHIPSRYCTSVADLVYGRVSSLATPSSSQSYTYLP